MIRWEEKRNSNHKFIVMMGATTHKLHETTYAHCLGVAVAINMHKGTCTSMHANSPDCQTTSIFESAQTSAPEICSCSSYNSSFLALATGWTLGPSSHWSKLIHMPHIIHHTSHCIWYISITSHKKRDDERGSREISGFMCDMFSISAAR